MTNRYANYGPNDDAPLVESDTFFYGVNEYDDKENLKPGEAQEAVNIDFSNANAATRGGFVCEPATAAEPFGSPWVSQSASLNWAWTGMAYGAGIFVTASATVGQRAVIGSADGGVTWDALAGVASLDATDTPIKIRFLNGRFYCVGTSGAIWSSTDGQSLWPKYSTGSTLNLGDIAYGNGTYVAVATNSGTNQLRALTSTDLSTWTERTMPLGGNIAVAYGNGLFVAVGINGTEWQIQTSPDGITWTDRTPSGSNGGLRDILFTGSKFVAVGIGDNVVSDDGITWTRYVPPSYETWRAVAYANGNYFAVGNNGAIQWSPNAERWYARTSPQAYTWNGLAASPDGIFAAATSSAVSDQFMTNSVGVQTVWASGVYSPPNAPTEEYTVLVGATEAGFYSFGSSPRFISYPSGYTISQQSTVVQANNYVIIMAGEGQTPLRWDGNWLGAFEEVPDTGAGAGFVSIPESNQATYYVNRLWVVDGKDTVAASDLLDFTTYDDIYQDFNLNIGNSDYVVCTYPFGVNSLVVFKNGSIQLLQNVDGGLSDVTATEITRQVGIVGINAVVGVGPDIVYMSGRNINTIRLTDTNNSVQHQTEPLSRNIRRIFRRINWSYAWKVSMAYWDNKLYVALPLDNATACNSVIVYNFITGHWFGEWNFNSDLGLTIQGWVISNYFGEKRLHCVTDDGRIFVTGEGQNDIYGDEVSEIATSLVTRAYRVNNQNRFNRRLYADLGTNRPNFSVFAYSEGASEESEVLTDQTFSRSDSWIFNDSTYAMNNSNDDYNRAGRKDYSTGPDSVQPGTGFEPEMLQEFRLPIITTRNGRLSWVKIENTQGRLVANGVGIEARDGYRNNYIQVI